MMTSTQRRKAEMFTTEVWNQAINWTRDIRANLKRSLPDLQVTQANIPGRGSYIYFFDRSNLQWYRLSVEPTTYDEAKMHGAKPSFEQPYDKSDEEITRSIHRQRALTRYGFATREIAEIESPESQQ